ncbi:NfeD family protein [Phaeovulum sp. W22_SRMD_FR3]|uniref:NfeD family protein n=1 Tax=Phaeovulum sp. W22_SRMD_FR3 TaxID=3240274 RepID=UPI003F9B82E6
MIWQAAWVWIAGGVALGVVEMLLPGFVFLGFALGAVAVGLLIWAGVLGGSWPLMVLVMAVVALVAWIVLRRLVGVRPGQVKIWKKDINDN